MAQNPNLPQLFRDIFKNAYLPYRDPETLKSFLKIINDFSYDHSEKLGDAFEYLLSVLGSQGDAGQFRTPRHVIDFMTVLIAPKKNETVLDPACGTAGFLISAYKHIFKENSSNYDKTDPYTFEQNNVKLAEITVNGKHYKGDKLSPDDRSRINQNIKGYDISPDMVRLSLVNLYLHGFTDPHIYEYDTLTSEERWNEFYDVILANPPFMSPKGGIRPHKRFAVQSKRSEVLFVDYMAEHLTPTGKAAIIVPEGIIFQSGTAYKSLRKMLVENNYLVGVISLPAGVFNPYSGVKTSILWLDKTLAKKTDKILFAKIENDGFDLGAQRRPIKENDLPAAFRALQEWKSILAGPPHGEAQSSSGLEAGPPHGEAPQMAPQSSAESPVRTGHGLSPQAAPQEPQQDSSESQILQSIFPNISLIEKEKIAENGEFNLSGERYRETVIINSDFPVIDFEDTFEKVVYPNKIKSRDFKEQGKYPIIDQSENYIAGFWNKVEDVFKLEKPVTIFGDHTRCFKYVDFDFVLGADGVKILQPIARFNPKFYYYLISSIHINNLGYSRHFKELKRKKIPLPPLSVQEEIVAEIESYQKIINGAHQVVENYKPKIDIDPEWELVELGDVCEIKSGGTPSRKEDAYWNGDIPWVGSTVCKDGYVAAAEEYISELGLKSSSAKIFESGTTLIALVGATIGKTGFLTFDCTTNQNIAGLIPKDEGNLDKKYLYFACQSIYENFLRLGEGKFRMATLSFVREQKIALPDIEIQRQIVTQIEKEQALVNANKQLIEIYEQKIKNRIAKVWGE
jgi:type I restriction enzyme M protein